MSEYTPTTDEVRAQWGYNYPDYDNRPEQFDRWLTSVKAEAWDEGFDSGVDHALFKDSVFNPYSIRLERAQKYIEKRFSKDTE